MRVPLRRCALVSVLLATAACGGTRPAARPAQNAPGFPVTVTNCGETITYERPPQRAVTLNQHATEIMLALGLEKSMAGTAYLDDAILPEYKAAYDGIKVLAEEYPSYEALLAAEPDFVYAGFESGFAAKEGRGRDVLAKAGIDTHVNIEECPAGPVTAAQAEEEIRTIGRIFGVQDRAERQVAAMRATLDRVGEALAGAKPVKVFVYDSGDKTAFTAGGTGIGNEMIKLAGGVNLFADLPKAWGDVSLEQVAERAPELIVIYDYGDTPLETKKNFLLSSPALKDVPAIKDRRFAVLPLSSAVLGVRVPAGVETLARQIHPDRVR
ncbi:ABC transporter substrate-binding protein [Nonomuraea typhae]|uniref:ABC transporter substrate-binding protein n=1 Tax=Nonomuraea typhae TaxID=2603600 RepID=UPI0012F94F0F|nr:ABC transporter substrate-binding protein [Nonomuraea typhae]